MRSRAYSYIRFSLARQQEGDSLRRQTALAEKWCRENGATLVENYEDLGVSAFRGKNSDEGALKKFLHAVEDGTVRKGDYLLVESLDRVGRQQVNRAMALLLQIINAGIIVVTLGSDQREYREDSPDLMSDLIMSLVFMSRAHEESETKSRRNRAAWDEKRRRGVEERKPITGRCPSWLKLEGDRFEVVEEKASLVREIFEMSASGMTVGGIARDLNSRGISPLRHASAWHPSTVSWILDARAVLGEFRPKSGNRELAVIADYFPQIVSEKLFAAGQRNRGRAIHNRGRRSPNVFRGVLFNPQGEPLQYKASGGLAYLRNYKADMGVRSGRMWRYDEFLEDFLAELGEHLRSTDHSGLNSAKIDRLKEEIKLAKEEISNLALALANGYSETIEKAIRDREEILHASQLELSELETAAEGRELTFDRDDPDSLAAVIRSAVAIVTMDTEERWWSAELIGGGVIESRPPIDC